MGYLEHADEMAEITAAFRKEYEPAPDHPRAVAETCEICGAPFYRYKGRKRHHCADCASKRGRDAGISMATRQGEAYEKAVRKQLAHWTAEAERLGLTP